MEYAEWRQTGKSVFRKALEIMRLQRALRSEGSWETLEGGQGRGCPVLMYHHVGPHRPGTLRGLTVSGRRFERQIRWLARSGYAGIRPLQWLRAINDDVALPAKPVIITFDDAYADIAEFALPVLLRYGFGGCAFVVTGLVGGTNRWDEAQGIGTLRLLNADQIRYWAEKGIEFGAHSRTHAELTTLSREQLIDEVIGSKRELEDILGSSVSSFAYPYGAQNDAVRELVGTNFGLAFGTMEGINFPPSDRHLLQRLCIGPNDPLIEFALIIRWGGRDASRKPCIQRGSTIVEG